ncbi:hypothetical protein SAMN05444156_0627 [Verrucomicrobium sp. GAS474]|uniref:hypothetical protein n=1 Tax=Verrucomicrobium sp. GAS474 TaxID=1882831 RepID=UPI00087D726A|nr:hypothetical protein [Verrucomicrobium sp. GAS474]SDT90725.1 hypothetical protein SAMN05444156_0627 [Verrucomicrobium sp. GAS474]
MALKLKNQPSSPAGEAPEEAEGRAPRINEKVDQKLTSFMEENQKATEYYRKLVREDPERAVRTIMLAKLNKYEDQMRLVEKQMPQVKQWIDQNPGMREKIEARIKDVNPIYKEIAFVNEAVKMRGRLDFSPSQGVQASLAA